MNPDSLSAFESLSVLDIRDNKISRYSTVFSSHLFWQSWVLHFPCPSKIPCPFIDYSCLSKTELMIHTSLVLSPAPLPLAIPPPPHPSLLSPPPALFSVSFFNFSSGDLAVRIIRFLLRGLWPLIEIQNVYFFRSFSTVQTNLLFCRRCERILIKNIQLISKCLLVSLVQNCKLWGLSQHWWLWLCSLSLTNLPFHPASLKRLWTWSVWRDWTWQTMTFPGGSTHVSLSCFFFCDHRACWPLFKHRIYISWKK